MQAKQPMTGDPLDQLRRELDYYRREHDALGARLLRLQEDQSRTAREARRSRTLAKLVRDAYRLVDRAADAAEVGAMMAVVLLEDMLCDRVAILRRLPDDHRFTVQVAVGIEDAPDAFAFEAGEPPDFCFTTAEAAPGAPEAALTALLGVPYVLWAYDRTSGYAAAIGNKSQLNVHRPFEAGDRELIEGALSVYLDVLTRKQTELALRAAKIQAEEAGRAQTRFIAKLSHELRTPLNAILGFSEVLGMAETSRIDIERCQSYAADIHEAGSYLLALINDILDFTAFGRETPAIVDAPIDLIDLLIESQETLRAVAERKGVSIRLEPAGPPPQVRADPVRMRQAMLNLIANAIKFTPSGGQVTLRARIDKDTGAAAIEVVDTGVGMSAEIVAEAFKPFFQAEDAIDYANEGVGLGLTIAKELVEAHGGEIALESAVGAGTTARITLPPSRTRTPGPQA